jgi:hypothetical protein
MITDLDPTPHGKYNPSNREIFSVKFNEILQFLRSQKEAL